RSKQAVLSLTRALEERDWRIAEEHAASQDLYTGKVSGYNKGGLIVRFGRVRGFVPASQVSEDRRQNAVGGSPLERWGAMIGEDIMVKVVEVDRNRNRLILSERAATKEVRDQRKAELLDHLEVGDIRPGHVVSLTDFGAFVDLGGADGLIHLTELSWKHVTRPDEVVKVGQAVQVKVISLDRDRRRIGLSMKSQGLDPWESVVSQFQVGQLVKGTITKLTKFGAFACLEQASEIEGLIHISELADHRVGHPREVVNEGEELTLRIVKIDRVQRRMGLSLKQVDAVDYLEIDLATYGDEQPPVLESIPTLPVEDEAAPAAEEAAPVEDGTPVEDGAVPEDVAPVAEEAAPADDAASDGDAPDAAEAR
ncbi:30S ribosomal protein S1, partial [Chloroflexota bacterium]